MERGRWKAGSGEPILYGLCGGLDKCFSLEPNFFLATGLRPTPDGWNFRKE